MSSLSSLSSLASRKVMVLLLLLAVCNNNVFLFLPCVHGKQGEGYDLPPDSDLRIGVKHRPKDCSVKSKEGDTLTIHYEGRLYKDNTKFDSSRDKNEPIKMEIGRGQVISGWDRGMHGMCVGQIRKIVIPANLAYGTEEDFGDEIHAGATLVFEVELLDLQPFDENKDYLHGMMNDHVGESIYANYGTGVDL